MSTIDVALTDALADMALSAVQQQQLAAHFALMVQWNARTNLTTITEPTDAAWQHYRDSLAGLPVLHAGPIIDLGSGAGFPGLVLAVARPSWHFCLLEPRQKRVSFLQAAIARLQLRNVQVHPGRLQDAPHATFAHAVTRATFSGAIPPPNAAAWLQPQATLVAWRAADAPQWPHSEVKAYSVRGHPRRLEICQRADL